KVRRQVAYAAARIGGAEARSLARHLLGDADSSVAAVAAFAVGELADTAAASLLAQRLVSPDSTREVLVRTEVAEALGKIGNDAARAAISGYLLGVDSAAATVEPAVLGAALLAGWRSGIAESAPFARWLSSPGPG